MKKNQEKPKLILHFDINRTIILKNSLQGDSMDKEVISYLCTMIWGKYDKNLTKFSIEYDKLSLERPRDDLDSLSNYIKKLYPEGYDVENSSNLSPEERKELTLQAEKLRTEKEKEFFKKLSKDPKFYSTINEIFEKIKVPKAVVDEIKNNINTKKYPKIFDSIYKEGYYFTFLSLFRTMIELQKQKRDFSILFRTFGNDSFSILSEFNAFCEGKHPLFSGENPDYPKHYFDGTHGSLDYRINTQNIGRFFRQNEKNENIFLIFTSDIIDEFTERNCNIYNLYKEELLQKKINIIQGGKNIYKYLLDKLNKGIFNSFLFMDDYFAWAEKGRNREFGKIFFINPYDYNMHQIFFDDNINAFPCSIVDCKNILTWKTLENEDSLGKYIIKSEAINAIMDEYYFLKLIHQAEEKRLKDKNESSKEKYEEMKDCTNEYKKLIDEAFDIYNKTKLKLKGVKLNEFMANYLEMNSSSDEK